MLGRYVLLTLGVIALLWTGYVAIDLIDKKDELAPLQYFGKEDGSILIIHRQNEVDLSTMNFNTTQENSSLINSLSFESANVKSVFLSEKRSHILLESNELWSRELVRELFKGSTEPLDFSGINSFKSGKYTGEIYRNRLYLSQQKYNTTVSENNWTKHDVKSSASLMTFIAADFTLTDIYFKSAGRIDYVTKANSNAAGNQVKDKSLFAFVLPSNLSNYHFYEKEYLGSIDATFKGNPMYAWMDKGMVEFTFNEQVVIISDYRESQDPVNSLFDFVKQDPNNDQYGFFEDVKLTKSFPNVSGSGFYAFSMDDFVVLSTDKETCEKIVAEYKLGNTLSQNPDRLEEIFAGLPERVSERFASSASKFSKTVYKSQLFQTILPSSKEKLADETVKPKESVTMKMGQTIQDFIVLNGNGNIITITKNGNVAAFTNGKRNWERNLGSSAIGTIEEANLNGQNYFVFTTKNGIHLIDQQGNSPSGFPFIINDSEFTTIASNYTWKNKSYFVIPDSKGNLQQIDFSGRKTNTLKTGLSDIQTPIDVWVSKRKLYFGVRNSAIFKMYDADSRREFRSFSILENSTSAKIENELIQFAISNSELIRFDQKGNKNTLKGNWKNFNLQGTTGDLNNNLIVYSTGVLKLIDPAGNVVTIINSNAKEIDNVSVNTMANGKTIICIVDGLENDVYLHGLNGQLFVNQSFDGTGKSVVTDVANGNYLLTTIVDDFIVQYSVN
ncbi:MAG: hypothetical protein NWS40_02950 [Crocinitomicaceae bacterium]|nr:hypothetical protein [Crocinitomicaceae bacterium]